jgi:alpha-L-fucosidase
MVYHASDDQRVRTADQLVDLYVSSVGRNSKLLLNVPPTRDGRLHDIDVARLTAFHAQLRGLFAVDLGAGKSATWRSASGVTTGEIDLGRSATVAAVRLEEPIENGQVVARYSVQGGVDEAWRVLSRGTTIGYAKIDRFEPTPMQRVRLVVEEAVSPPDQIAIKLYA